MNHLKLSEQEQANLRSSRWKEIIWIWAEINEMEIKRVVEQIDERKSWFFKKINKFNKLLA
jgi:hypothetical protein